LDFGSIRIAKYLISMARESNPCDIGERAKIAARMSPMPVSPSERGRKPNGAIPER